MTADDKPRVEVWLTDPDKAAALDPDEIICTYCTKTQKELGGDDRGADHCQVAADDHAMPFHHWLTRAEFDDRLGGVLDAIQGRTRPGRRGHGRGRA